MHELFYLHFVEAMIPATILVVATIFIHYEALRLSSIVVESINGHPRFKILVAICMLFLAHTVEVWLFAIGYYIMDIELNIGGFAGELAFHATDYIYFSVTSYTSLGLGDVFPTGAIRLITGVEALVGLIMIAWSGSYTYILMQKLWPLHVKKEK